MDNAGDKEAAQQSVRIQKSVPVIDRVDVLVVGSGIAGSNAAVTAARNGAKTMVVDRFGSPGGNMGPGSIGGAPNLELPESMAKDGVPGIPGEFIRRCEEYCRAPLLNHYFRDSQVISYVWLKMMEESGIRLMFNTFAADPIMEGDKVIGLIVENKSGTQAVIAKVVIDATGDADVAARAGAPVDNGNSLFDPGIFFSLGNVDIDTFENEVIRKDPSDEDARWAENLQPIVEHQLTGHLKFIKPFAKAYRAAWESGEYRFLELVRDRWTLFCDHGIFRSVCGYQYQPDPLRKGRYGIVGALVGIRGPWDDKDEPTSGSAWLMNELEVRSRLFIFETAQFLKNRVLGFEESYLHFVAPYFHARGGRSIVSECPLTVDGVQDEPLKDDVVFVAAKPRHKSRPDWRDVTGADVYGNAPTASFDFPYRQLLPQKIDGLLAAGRAAIIQPPVTRVRWMVMLMGQAAGAAAALAARRNVPPRELDVRELQKLLYTEYGVPLGDAKRLKELGIA